MDRLSGADVRGVLTFVEDAWSLAGERAFPLATLEALAELIPCDEIGYADLDRLARCQMDYVGTDGADGDTALFWDIVDDHPLCRHQLAYADFTATRLSDVISHRQLMQSRIYADWFRPAGIVAELEGGIAPSRTRTRTFVLDRTSGDFSERDRTVLDLVRPHLARIHEMTELRRGPGATPDDLERLTARERDVLELVGAGLTNAAIAERLWISPGTVKKHLDNIYGKLGVANRTQAASRVRAR